MSLATLKDVVSQISPRETLDKLSACETWSEKLRLAGLALGGAAGACYLWARYRDRGLPPGPTGWPLFGASSYLQGDFHLEMHRLASQYGDVCSVRLGTELHIILASQSAIKEAFVTCGDKFAHRPYIKCFDYMGIEDDILTRPMDSPNWSQNKAFLVSTLRTAGMGVGHGMQERVTSQIEKLVRHLEKDAKAGHPVDLHPLLPLVTAGVVLGVFFSREYEMDDPKLAEWAEKIRLFVSSFAYGFVMDPGPFDFPRDVKKQIRVNTDNLKELVAKEIEDHINSLDPEQPRDLLDHYILRYGLEENYKRIVDNVILFMNDLTDTVALCVEWILFYITHHLKVQERIQAEVADVTSNNRYVTLDDRPNLPFTEATIMEVMRMASPFPHSAPHTVNEDITFRGYRIPKGVKITANFHSVHMDPNIYINPESFQPERFLSPGGKLRTSDTWMAFSLGRRKCSGEQFARQEMFLFTANLLQQYNFRFPDGEKPALAAADNVVIRSPGSFKVIVTPRI